VPRRPPVGWAFFFRLTKVSWHTKRMLNDAAQLEKLRATIAPVCAAHGLDLVDARFTSERGMVLQVLIERPG